jgi:hypothetical protein
MSEAEYAPLAGVVRLLAPLDADTPPAAVFERMLAVTVALAGTCEPLALDLVLAGRAPGMPLLEPDPAPSAWQLVEAGVPAEVVIRPPDAPDAHVEDTPALTPDAAREWAARVLAQPPPEPGLELTPASLGVAYTRARIGDAPDAYVVLDDGAAVPQPLERRAGGTWVLAPPRDLLMQPPVSWRVVREDDLHAELWVNWTPWLDPERPEGAGVRAAVRQLQLDDWELRAPVHPLGLTP